MAKAFDRISWEFLQEVLYAFGIAPFFIELISRCIHGPWFSVIINGGLEGFFQSTRGVRQGDPLSPTLFIIAVEFLIRGVNKLFESEPRMQFHTGVTVPVNCLAFADDFILFTNGSKDCLSKIRDFLKRYEDISGQMVNTEKSSYTTSPHTPLHRHHIISSCTGFRLENLPITYLGIRLYKGHGKNFLFEPLIASIRDRLSSWQGKFLSLGGRVTLIQAVLNSLPIYTLQVLELTSSVISRIELLFNRFLWSGTSANKSWHWASWKKMCYPYAEGGINVRSVSDSQSAFSGKLWWRFRSSNTIWSRYMSAKYVAGRVPHLIDPRPTDSLSWKRLLKGRASAEEFIGWDIGTGEAYFWFDNWTVSSPLFDHVQEVDPSARVKDFISGHSWDISKLMEVLPFPIVSEIIQVPIGTQGSDMAVWKLSSNGSFSIKSLWNNIRESRPVDGCFAYIWHQSIPPAISAHMWRVLQGWIPVDEVLKRKGIALASQCFCCKSEESLHHILVSGPFAREVWLLFCSNFHIRYLPTMSIRHVLLSWLSNACRTRGHLCALIPLIIFWELWRARNRSRHEGVQPSLQTSRTHIIRKIQVMLYTGGLRPKHVSGVVSHLTDLGIELPSLLPRHRPNLVAWTKPPLGFVKLNTDGAFSCGGFSGGGGVLRNHKGECLKAFSLCYPAFSALHSELIALYEGLLMCVRHGYRNVVVETDSRQVIDCVLRRRGAWRSTHLIDSIIDIIPDRGAKLQHILREGNSVADRLAKLGAERGHIGEQDFVQLPSLVRSSILLEQVDIPYIRV